MITIDGALGEGGGQVLRTALSLSLVTGCSFSMINIRAKRRKPGLLHQHLTAVLAAGQIGCAKVEGAALGSLQLSFAPSAREGGIYHFAIGTAGSCILVLQTLLAALMTAGSASELIVDGGTHNPHAPTYEFFTQTYLPLVNRMGPTITAVLERPGFYPAGGGRIRVRVSPAAELAPLELTARGRLKLTARALCAGLPEHIGRRELEVIRQRLRISGRDMELVLPDRCGTGNVVHIFAKSDQLVETFISHGSKGVPAERVAEMAVEQVNSYLSSLVPVGPYLADQLLLPVVLAKGGTFLTGKPTAHTLTNIEVINRFPGCRVYLRREDDDVWRISGG